MQFPQVFKKRTDALRFVQGWDYPFKERTFYNFCDKYSLVEPDKTVLFNKLVAALWSEYPPNQHASSMGEAEKRSERMAKLEEEKLELEVEKRRKENRKEDANWIERDKVFEREGALIGQLFGEVRYQNGKLTQQIVSLFGVDQKRAAEVRNLLEESAFSAFRNLYETGEVDMTFEEEED